ncbi:Methyltransferase domain protein [Rosistilla oblonga]|uniref:class I SAM-dependent methyltransferase n=1 Tax=Rosistilla oblonga TaxID=2527990 RepID=UPI00118A86DD|nr:Methyltransferase domain protein [Rosistilla oblonga]
MLNLLGPRPYSDRIVDAIYAGELWEHLERDAASRLTRECLRVLKPGGVLRICVPDGEAFWREYLRKLDEQLARPPLEREACSLDDHVRMYFRDICTRRRLLGSMGHFHKWQYDEVQLTALFSDSGFREVRRHAFHDSRIPDIEQVERSDFLIVEGVR